MTSVELTGGYFCNVAVHDRDVVPTLPYAFLGYQHTGLEVVVNAEGECLMAPTDVERFFRPRQVTHLLQENP